MISTRAIPAAAAVALTVLGAACSSGGKLADTTQPFAAPTAASPSPATAQTGPLASGAYLGNDKDGDGMEVSLADVGKDLKIARMVITFRSDREKPVVLGKDHPFGVQHGFLGSPRETGDFGVSKADDLDFVVGPNYAQAGGSVPVYVGRVQKTPTHLLSRPANTITVTLRKATQNVVMSLEIGDLGLFSNDAAKNLKDQYDFVLEPRKL